MKKIIFFCGKHIFLNNLFDKSIFLLLIHKCYLLPTRNNNKRFQLDFQFVIHIREWSQKMKQLTNKQHLVYMLEKSHLVTSLPFVDQEIDNQIPKSKVSYLIMTEQAEMQKDPQGYIKNLQISVLKFANSEQFDKEVERVNKKIAEKQAGQAKKKEFSYPEIPKKITKKDQQKYLGQVKKGIVAYQNSLTKNLNLELYKKYGPLVLKELIEVIQRQRVNLQEAIQKQKQALEELNKNRKYQQIQTYQRQYDIGERIKIMLNKRRKVQ